VQNAISFGCPRSEEKGSPPSRLHGRGIVADVHALRSARPRSQGSPARGQLHSSHVRIPDGTPEKQEEMINSAGDKANNASRYDSGTPKSRLQRSNPESTFSRRGPTLSVAVAAPVSKEKPSASLAGSPAEKTVRRTAFKSMQKASSLPALGSSVEDGDQVSHARRPTQRRRTLAVPSLDGLASENAKLDCRKVTDKQWELNCTRILWLSVPPQSVSYAIGVAVHSARRGFRLLRIVQTAWSLLDATSAVECIMGPVGLTRLRSQMDALIDQFARCGSFESDAATEELAQLVHSTQITLVKLNNMCESDSRFAQTVTLYGVAFITEGVCTWSQTLSDAQDLTAAGRDLLQTLLPHLTQLFQKSD